MLRSRSAPEARLGVGRDSRSSLISKTVPRSRPRARFHIDSCRCLSPAGTRSARGSQVWSVGVVWVKGSVGSDCCQDVQAGGPSRWPGGCGQAERGG